MAAAVQINRLDLSVFRSAIKITRGHGVNGNDVTTVYSRDDSLVVLLMGGLPVQPRHLCGGLLPWAANICAMRFATEDVSANGMFDITATTMPYSGNVIKEATLPRGASPS